MTAVSRGGPGAPARVGDEEELQQVLLDWWARRLQHEDVARPHRLLNVDLGLSVREAAARIPRRRHPERLAHLGAETCARRAGEHHQPVVHVHLLGQGYRGWQSGCFMTVGDLERAGHAVQEP